MDWARRVVATRTFKILFVVVIAAAVLGGIFGEGASEPERAQQPATTTTKQAITTTISTIVVSPTDTKLPPIQHLPPPPPRQQRAQRTTGAAYCGHYANWQRAEAAILQIERRNPSENVNDWRPGDVGRWADSIDARAAAANRLWGAAPAGYTWADIRREC